LEDAWIKPPIVYAIAQSLLPGIKLEKPIIPEDLAALLVETIKAGR
jgi:hypothetical protein